MAQVRRWSVHSEWIHGLKLWILARRTWKVFLSADVLGHCADLFCACRDSAVARPRATKEAAGDAARRDDGAAGSLRLNDWISVAGSCGRGVAHLGAWLHRGT